VVKPSEISANTANALADLFPKYLDPNAYAVVTGAVPETTYLLSLKWDFILFTGSSAVGKVIAAAAAKHATPCALELGGASPVVIADDADLDLAAKRIIWGCVTLIPPPSRIEVLNGQTGRNRTVDRSASLLTTS
jgi:aldehyde dehydrogenase (NAD+)